ncbi:MAG: hypothetical protein AB2A00_37815 [Myxococcota bacterium]
MKLVVRGVMLAGGLVLSSCEACQPREIPEACQNNNATPYDPVICPRISPIVLRPPLPGVEETFAFEVNNESTTADLEIKETRFQGRDTAVFYNLKRDKDVVRPGDQAVIQFNYKQQDLTEKRAELVIVSNAKNYPELKIDVVIREGVIRDAGTTDEDAGQ